MEFTINIPEWVASILVILLALKLADITLDLIQAYYEYRIRKRKDKGE